MKLNFYGAARAVTGSCHCLDVCGKRILVDCGLQQGADEIDNAYLPFDINSISCVLVTHAHIDHSGRLPLLAKMGYTGPVYSTSVTRSLLEIMLRDSAHIHESDAAWLNRKNKRAGRPAVDPLYTVADADKIITQVVPFEYGQQFEVCDGVRARFIDAGHLIGSAFIEFTVNEDGKETKIVFSGDIGNTNQPIIADPTTVTEADFVVMESTYGDREHENVQFSRVNELSEIINDTFARGGNIVIPSFAVGRTQELLYFLREIKEKNLVPDHPNFPVYIDSPLAVEATKIFSGEIRNYLDAEALKVVGNGDSMFTFAGLHMCKTSEESKLLNFDHTPKVIISASGMCDAGRIRHHLKHNLWRGDSTVVFVGYQAEGSLGRKLLDGAEKVKLFGEEIQVQAKIINLPGLSSHAGKTGLINWITAFAPKPKEVFVVHGEASVAESFAGTLNELGINAHAPLYGEVYDLNTMSLEKEGTTPLPAKREKEVSEPYAHLVTLAEKLLVRVKQSRGFANKELKKLASKIQSMLDTWDD